MEDFQTYADSGLDTLYLTGKNSFYGTSAEYSVATADEWQAENQAAWDSSTTKQCFDLAQEAGIEKIILRDNRLYIQLFDKNFASGGRGESARESLVGDGCMFATEAELDEYVAACMKPYIQNELLYGLGLMDEPQIENLTVCGQIYRSIKRVAKNVYGRDIYIQLNLLPLDETGSAARFTENYQSVSLTEAYTSYLSSFIEVTGAGEICMDYYAFKPTSGGRFVNGFYSCLQIYADVVTKYDVEIAFVLQSFEYVHTNSATLNGYRKLTDIREMYLQLNSALGFGVKDISFYTYEVSTSAYTTTGSDGETLYWSTATVDYTLAKYIELTSAGTPIFKNDGETLVYGTYSWTKDGSFVTSAGETTETYDFAKEAIEYAKAVHAYIGGYVYNAAAINVSDAASAYESVYKSSKDMGTTAAADFEDGEFALIESAVCDKDILLVTELYSADENGYAYMVQNVLDPAYEEDGATAMNVSVSFATGVSQLLVIENGAASYVTVENGVYETTLELGEAVFIIPVN